MARWRTLKNASSNVRLSSASRSYNDNSDLLVYQADTLEELAVKMNVDPDTLVAEIIPGLYAAGSCCGSHIMTSH